MHRRRAAILCNGASILEHDLSKNDCETIGINASWKLIQSTHHVMTDSAQWEMYERETGKKAEDMRGLVTGPNGPGEVKVQVHRSHIPAWSTDPFGFGVYLCGSVTHMALQLAVHAWQYKELYFIGLDLYPQKSGSGKFYGGQWHASAEVRQRETLAYARAIMWERYAIRVWNVNPDSKCASFEHKSFEECFGTERK